MTGSRLTPIQILERLIAFDTTSSKSNLELIAWIEAYLAGHGVAARRSGNPEGTKANLFATLGPEIAGGLVLSGHSDVVPVEGQAWDSDPFRLIERDGRLYGRGTADMKSFLALALAMVPDFLAAGLKRPIHLAISYDEEIGCLGVGRMIADITTNLPRPAMVLIGEPTSGQVVNAHKGVYGYRTRITGKEAHSSQPQSGGNAILAAAALAGFLEQRATERQTAQDPHLAPHTVPQTAPGDAPHTAPGADSGAGRFEPPYTTFNVGLIAGGAALNIIPRDCSLSWEIRPVPGDDPDALLAEFTDFATNQVLPKLRAHAPEAAIVTETLARVPPLSPETEGAAETLIRQLTGANRTTTVSFGTEGGIFQEAGFSTVVCGPGAIDQAHQPDEFIEKSQLEAGWNLLRRLRDWAARG